MHHIYTLTQTHMARNLVDVMYTACTVGYSRTNNRIAICLIRIRINLYTVKILNFGSPRNAFSAIFCLKLAYKKCQALSRCFNARNKIQHDGVHDT